MLKLQADKVYADVEGGEWSGRATWLTSQHESQALATALAEGLQEQAPALPLEVTIGFKRSESTGQASRKNRKHRSHSHTQDIVLSTTIGAKVVTRYRQPHACWEADDMSYVNILSYAQMAQHLCTLCQCMHAVQPAFVKTFDFLQQHVLPCLLATVLHVDYSQCVAALCTCCQDLVAVQLLHSFNMGCD